MVSVSCSYSAGDPGDMEPVKTRGVFMTSDQGEEDMRTCIHEDTYSWIQSAWLVPLSGHCSPVTSDQAAAGEFTSFQ